MRRLLALALMLGACRSGGAAPAVVAGPDPDLERVPAFEAQTLDGHRLRYDSPRTRATLFAFWASWCESCRAELPELTRIQRLHQDSLELIGVNVDTDPEKGQRFAAEAHATYPSLADGALVISDLLRVQKTPTFLVVGKSGEILHRGHAIDGPLTRAIDAACHQPDPPAKAAAPGGAQRSSAVPAPRILEPEPVAKVHRQAVRMGTEIELMILTDDVGEADRATADALAEISRIEAMMTDWRDDSALSAINLAAGKAPVSTPRELLELLVVSKNISKATGGTFDVSFAGVGQLWDFKTEHPALPSPEAVKAALAHVGWERIQVDPEHGTAFLPEAGMRLGLGGIAKGYAVERAARVIREHGFKSFAVKAGGDMRIEGTWAGKPWQVGIRDPRDREAVIALVPISNMALSTSGDYERYFELDGKRYGHILDPRTGYPVDHTWSVTLIAPDCTISDGLAKGVFVLGAEEGMKLVESIEGVEAVIVDARGEIHVSSGLRNRIHE